MTVADPGALAKMLLEGGKGFMCRIYLLPQDKDQQFSCECRSQHWSSWPPSTAPACCSPSPGAGQMTSLLLVDMYPVNIDEIARSCSKLISVTIDTITHIVNDNVIAEAVVVCFNPLMLQNVVPVSASTYVMATQLAET